MQKFLNLSTSSRPDNQKLIQQYRKRASKKFVGYNFLHYEVGSHLVNHLDNIRQCFPLALDLGCKTGIISQLIGKKGGISFLVQSELSESMTQTAQFYSHTSTIVANEEYLPFGENYFDLVLSNLSLHSVRNLHSVLTQVHQFLKPNGLFLASLVGDTSLPELTTVFGMISNTTRTSLSSNISNILLCLQYTGFKLPIVDYDTIVINYTSPLQLLLDLRGMGENNILECYTPICRKTLQAISNYYHACHASKQSGYISATFQVLYLTAWALD